MINIQREWILELCSYLMDGHIKYGMGAKAPSLTTDPKSIKVIDCSGFTRYLLHQATDGQVTMPEGSDEQNAWCKRRKLRSEKYMQVAGLKDGNLRIGFIPRDYKDGKVARAGHVWFVMDGRTMESHGSRGPNRRNWNNPRLTSRVKSCYVLAHLYSMTMGPLTVATA